jgi:hypothetical protein
MASDAFAQTMNLIASQLEAASTLLKYAADDLKDLSEKPNAPMLGDLQLISQNLLAQAAVIDGNAVFCVRLGEEIAQGGDGDASQQANFDSEIAG